MSESCMDEYIKFCGHALVREEGGEVEVEVEEGEDKSERVGACELDDVMQSFERRLITAAAER